MEMSLKQYETPQFCLEELECEGVVCVSGGQIEDSGETGGFVFPNLP